MLSHNFCLGGLNLTASIAQDFGRCNGTNKKTGHGLWIASVSDLKSWYVLQDHESFNLRGLVAISRPSRSVRQMVSGFMTSREAPFLAGPAWSSHGGKRAQCIFNFSCSKRNARVGDREGFSKASGLQTFAIYLVGTLKKFAGHLRDVSLGANGAMHRRNCPCDLTRKQS